MLRCFIIVVSATAFVGAAYSQEDKTPLKLAELSQLTTRLGDRDYRIREEAGKRLLGLGVNALPTLRKVAETANREAAARALELIAKIEKRIDHAKETAGTFVELAANEHTVDEALASLRKQTGYALELVGDQTAPAAGSNRSTSHSN